MIKFLITSAFLFATGASAEPRGHGRGPAVQGTLFVHVRVVRSMRFHMPDRLGAAGEPLIDRASDLRYVVERRPDGGTLVSIYP